MVSAAKKERHRKYLVKIQVSAFQKFNRPGQAPISGDFWIARRISLPIEQFFHPFGVPFRHLTIEGAIAEADRRSVSRPGEIYGVFSFTGIARVAEKRTERTAE